MNLFLVEQPVNHRLGTHVIPQTHTVPMPHAASQRINNSSDFDSEESITNISKEFYNDYTVWHHYY